jgi:thiol-disulfide isomerase/thioredoxin
MKIVHIILLYCCLPILGEAQTPVIGMIAPDLPLSKTVNGSLPYKSIGSLKGKYIIIDNWATWCAPCVGGLEHMQALADSFPNLQFIMVSQEPKQVQKEFFGKHPIGKKIKLPAIAEDSIMRRTFPYITIPHLIWINDKGMIDAITGKDELTGVNLIKWMNKEKIKLAVKKDELGFNPFINIPLIFNDYNTNKEELLVYSYLSGEHKGMSSIAHPPSKQNNTWWLRVTNTFPLNHYVFAYGEVGTYWPLARVIAECSNPERFSFRRDKQMTIYSYDLIAKDTANLNRKDLFVYMQKDLDRYFKVKSSIEKREIPCLVVRKLSDTVRLPVIDELKPTLLLTDEQFIFNKSPLSSILGKYCNLIPWMIIDETGIKGNVGIRLPLGKKTITLDSVKEALQKIGLVITEEKRVMDAIVIRDP